MITPETRKLEQEASSKAGPDRPFTKRSLRVNRQHSKHSARFRSKDVRRRP